MLEEACKRLNFQFRPAYREDKWRNHDEMVSYYQNEIDIYVDVSESAGRQGGLVESGACGKAIIASRAGIAEELIDHGKNGFLVDRNVDSIVNVLKQIVPNIDDFGKKIRKTIEDKWSWKIQAPMFENIFSEFIKL